MRISNEMTTLGAKLIEESTVYAQIFLIAAEEFFQEISLPLKELQPAPDSNHTYRLTGSLGITGSIHGYFVLQSDLATARNLVAGMAARLGVTFDELGFGPFHRATIGEIANQIAGKALMKLENYGVNCMLTPPTIFIGDSVTFSFPHPNDTMEKTCCGEFGALRFFVSLNH